LPVSPETTSLNHIVKGLADHEGHHNQHQLVQLLIDDLCRFDNSILCELQRILLQDRHRYGIGQSPRHQHGEYDHGQECGF
jgi:hypothetical protein